MSMLRYPTVLAIAGFDGSGGAGLQADLKTCSALGCYATSVLTALPVQNTTGVKSIYPIPDPAVREQLVAVLGDIPPQAVKIGMVHTSELVNTIVTTLKKYPAAPLVFDPVMVATSGHRLIEAATIVTIIEQLFPLATLITPNMDEAGILAGMPVITLEDMYMAGEKIRRLGCRSVLLKGGHLQTEQLTSLFFDEQGNIHPIAHPRVDTRNTHGSGCTLSSAIASYLAHGEDLLTAVVSGQEYAYQAILQGSDVVTGHGNGPLNHFFNPEKLQKHELV